MKKLDFFIQTLIILCGLAAGIAAIFDNQNFLFVMVVQFFLGCWQMLGSFLSLLVRGPLFKLKSIHFFLSSIYLASLALPVRPELQAIYLTVPAWALGIYYYILSFKGTFRMNKNNGSFLPHLSF